VGVSIYRFMTSSVTWSRDWMYTFSVVYLWYTWGTLLTCAGVLTVSWFVVYLR